MDIFWNCTISKMHIFFSPLHNGSRHFIFGDYFLNSHNLYARLSNVIVRRNELLISLLKLEGLK